MRRLVVPAVLSVLLLLGWAPLAASAAPRTAMLPAVKGTFGQAPTITFPKTAAPATLVTKVLHAGNGPVVAKGDLLVANYLGQIWKGKVFDSSFKRGEPSAFAIGVGKVIPGWDKALVGVHSGSRLLLVVPPKDGYGKTGNSSAGIKGTDTLVFVVDVISSYGHTVSADRKAKPVAAKTGGVQVSGALNAAPTIAIAKHAAQPKTQTQVVLDRGTGPAVRPGLLVLQIVADNWSGQVVQSTWTAGTPEGDPVGDPRQPDPLDKLIGVPLGSRVLMELPKSSSGGPYALVLDLVAQPKGAKSQLH